MNGIVAKATVIFSGFVMNGTIILVIIHACDEPFDLARENLVEPTVISSFVTQIGACDNGYKVE